MDWVLLGKVIERGIPIVGIPALFVYQHYRIRGLKDKIKDQSELIKTAKTVYETMDPEVLKVRIETYEKTLKAEQKIQEEKMKAELAKAIEQRSKDVKAAGEHIGDLTSALMSALFKLPNHELREEVVGKMKTRLMREMMEDQLPKFREWDEERSKAYVNFLAPTGLMAGSPRLGLGLSPPPPKKSPPPLASYGLREPSKKKDKEET